MKTIYLSGEVGWEIRLSKIRDQIDPTSKEKLRLIIDSNGGDTYEGFRIYNFLKTYKGKIEVVIGAMAASAASYIAMVALPEDRKGFKNSSAMIHEARSGIYGRARDLEIHAKRVEGVNNIAAETYAEGLGITKEDARMKMTEDFYMTGWEELVENNFISEIIDIEDVEIPEKENNEDEFMFFMSMSENIKSKIDRDVALTKMYDAEDKSMADLKKNKENFEKIAAQLEFKPDKPDEDNKIKMEAEMELTEFLKTNSKAKAEHDELLLEAEAKGKESIEITGSANIDTSVFINEERTRISGILSAAGVELNENTIKALSEGLSVSDFKNVEFDRMKALSTGKKKETFGDLKVSDNLVDTKDVPGVKTDKDIETSVSAIADKLDKENGGI